MILFIPVASEQSWGTLSPSCKPYPVQFQSTMQAAKNSPLLSWQELKTFSEHGWQMLKLWLRENNGLSWSFMCSASNVLQYPWPVAKCVLIELGDVCQCTTQSYLKLYKWILHQWSKERKEKKERKKDRKKDRKKERQRERYRERGVKVNLVAKVMPSACLRLQCNSRVKCVPDWFQQRNVVRMLPREGISRCLCGHILFALVGTCWNLERQPSWAGGQTFPKRLKDFDHFASTGPNRPSRS